MLPTNSKQWLARHQHCKSLFHKCFIYFEYYLLFWCLLHWLFMDSYFFLAGLCWGLINCCWGNILFFWVGRIEDIEKKIFVLFCKFWEWTNKLSGCAVYTLVFWERFFEVWLWEHFSEMILHCKSIDLICTTWCSVKKKNHLLSIKNTFWNAFE